MRRYLVGTTGDYSKPLGKRSAIRLAVKRAARWTAPYHVVNHERRPDTGSPRTLPEARDKLDRLLGAGHVGDRFDVIASDERELAVRIVERKIAVAPINGTPALRKIHRAVFARHPSVVTYGRYSRRPIAGSSSWSQHAYCPPNAEDFHAGRLVMRKIADYLVRNAGRLDVEHVIYDREIWSRSVGAWRAYGGENPHTDHVHADGHPNRTGTPPVTCNQT